MAPRPLQIAVGPFKKAPPERGFTSTNILRKEIGGLFDIDEDLADTERPVAGVEEEVNGTGSYGIRETLGSPDNLEIDIPFIDVNFPTRVIDKCIAVKTQTDPRRRARRPLPGQSWCFGRC